MSDTYTQNLKGAAAYAILIMGKALNGGGYTREQLVEAQNRLSAAVTADGSFIHDALYPPLPARTESKGPDHG